MLGSEQTGDSRLHSPFFLPTQWWYKCGTVGRWDSTTAKPYFQKKR